MWLPLVVAFVGLVVLGCVMTVVVGWSVEGVGGGVILVVGRIGLTVVPGVTGPGGTGCPGVTGPGGAGCPGGTGPGGMGRPGGTLPETIIEIEHCLS